MRHLFLLLLVMAIRNDVQSQQKNNAKETIHFHSFNTLQLLAGNSITSVAIQSVNGFQLGRLFAGIGLGYDWYYHPSTVLFFEPRFTVLKKAKHTVELYAQAGYNLPSPGLSKVYDLEEGLYKNGRYYGFGADCLLPVKKNAFVLGVGFSSKAFTRQSDLYVYNPVTSLLEYGPFKYKYTLNRITIRAGWMF